MPPLHTPSQTIGPFFHVVLASPAPEAPTLSGAVLDGADAGVSDALVEIWDGRALARCHTDAAGRFAFALPLDAIAAATPADEAPHVVVSLFARGLLGRVTTRCYLPCEAPRLEADAFLAAVPEERRATLLALRTDAGLHFDLRLQGARETVFHVW